MEALFLNVVNLSLTSCWFILAVLVLRFLLKKAPAWVNCLLWGFAGFRLVCPFSIKSALSLIPSAKPLTDDIIYTSSPQIQSGIPSVDKIVNPALASYFPPDPVASINQTQLLSFIFSRIWLLVMACMILYALRSYLRLKNRLSTATLLQDNVKQSEKIDSPFVLGFIQPTIYLPYHMDDAYIQHVIAHEQAHIRRLDHLWKYIGFILLSVHWFNPFVWIAYHLFCRDIEVACDEKVIKTLTIDDRRAYSTALLHCSLHRNRISACPLAFGEVGVKERIKNVMNYKKPSFWITLSAIILCMICAICLLTDPKTDVVGSADLSKNSSSSGDSNTNPSGTFDSQAASSESTDTSMQTQESEVQIYWTKAIDDYTVSLQDGIADQTLEVHVEKDGKNWNVLTLDISYDFESVEEIMIDTFEGILGHDGFRIYKHSSMPYSSVTYYIGVAKTPIYLADTMGEFQFPDTNDYSVDLDGDGCMELISDILYVADGAMNTSIYHWNGHSVEIYSGTDVMEAAEPPYYIIWANSFGAQYLPNTNQIRAWHWDSKTAGPVMGEYDIDLPALKQYIAERASSSENRNPSDGSMTSEIYSEESALDMLRTHLILAYEIVYGPYTPSDEPLPEQPIRDAEYLRRLIPKLYVKEETDQYYIIPVIWDFWVDKYTGEIFKFYNGIDPMLIPFDYSDPNALSFAG